MSAKPDFSASVDVDNGEVRWENLSGGMLGYATVQIESPRPSSGLNKGLEALTGDYRVEIPVTAPEGTVFSCSISRKWVYPFEKYGIGPEHASFRNSGKCGEVTVTGGKVTFIVTGADLTASSWPIRNHMDKAWYRNVIAFAKLYYSIPADKATGDAVIKVGKAQIYATTLSGAEYSITSVTEPFTRRILDATKPFIAWDIYNQGDTPDYQTPGYAITKTQPVGINFKSWFENSGNLKGKNATACAMFSPEQLNVAKALKVPAEYYRGSANSMNDGFACGMFGDNAEGWSSDATDLSNVKAVRVKGKWPIAPPVGGDQNNSLISLEMIRAAGDTSAIGAQLPIRFMITADGTPVGNDPRKKYASSYFTAVDGNFTLNTAWDKPDGLFGQVRSLNLGFTAKDGLNQGTVTAKLPACLKVTDPGSGTLTAAANSVNREDCSIYGDTVTFPVVDGDPGYVVQAQVMSKRPQTGNTWVILKSDQQPLSEVRRSKSVAFTTGRAEQVTASVSTSAPENTATLENGSASVPFTLSWGNATTGEASGELVWLVPEGVKLASVGSAPAGANVQCTTATRAQITTALEADKSGVGLTWAACPAQSADLAGVNAVRISTGNLAAAATGLLPVKVTASAVGDVATSFTAGVFTTASGQVNFADSTPISVYVREPAPQPTVTKGEWTDATDAAAKNCDTKKVTQVRTVTTTPAKWDSAAKKWVADPDNASVNTETQTRDMNEGEIKVCMAGTGVPTYPDTPIPPGGKVVIPPSNGPDNPAQCEPSGPTTRADGVIVTVDSDCNVTITVPEGNEPGPLDPPVNVTPVYPTPDNPQVEVPVRVIDTPDWDDTTTTPDTPVDLPKKKGDVPEDAKVEVTGPGDAVINPDGSITVTPNPGTEPGAKIIVKVTDKTGNPLDTVTVTIVPEATPDGPNWDDTVTEPGKNVDVPNKGGNVPGDTTITVTGPGTGTLNPDGTITVTPDKDAKPGSKITVTVLDKNGNKLDTFTVTIIEIKKPKALPSTGSLGADLTGNTTGLGLAGSSIAVLLAGGFMLARRRKA